MNRSCERIRDHAVAVNAFCRQKGVRSDGYVVVWLRSCTMIPTGRQTRQGRSDTRMPVLNGSRPVKMACLPAPMSATPISSVWCKKVAKGTRPHARNYSLSKQHQPCVKNGHIHGATARRWTLRSGRWKKERRAWPGDRCSA